MSDKKILAVCLSVAPPMFVRAAWHKSVLTMDNPEKLPTQRRAMEVAVLNAIEEAQSKGFEVLIEETTSFITSRAGQRIRLGENDESGKPLLLSTLNIYRELDRQKAVNLPKMGAGSFDLPDSIFDSDKDARGTAVYHVDWARLKPQHILTMLCCYATQNHNPASVSFLQKMFGVSQEQEQRDRYTPFRNIIDGIEQRGLENTSVSQLTGKRNIL